MKNHLEFPPSELQVTVLPMLVSTSVEMTDGFSISQSIFKLPVKAFGGPAEDLFQVFWFPEGRTRGGFTEFVSPYCLMFLSALEEVTVKRRTSKTVENKTVNATAQRLMGNHGDSC